MVMLVLLCVALSLLLPLLLCQLLPLTLAVMTRLLVTVGLMGRHLHLRTSFSVLVLVMLVRGMGSMVFPVLLRVVVTVMPVVPMMCVVAVGGPVCMLLLLRHVAR